MYHGTRECLVVAPTIGGRLSIMHEGKRAECRRYVRTRARYGQPTHFCYIVTNTYRAVEAFKRRIGL